MATQLGTDLKIGIGQTMGSYVVAGYEENDDEVKIEDVEDEDGVLKTRIILQTQDRIRLTLIPISGATPASDFVKGAICAVAPLSNYYIEDSRVSRAKGAWRVEVTAINLGIT